MPQISPTISMWAILGAASLSVACSGSPDATSGSAGQAGQAGTAGAGGSSAGAGGSSAGTGGSSAGAAGAGATGGAGGATAGSGGSMLAPCDAVPGASYASLPTVGPVTDKPADLHGDLNVKLRGWSPVGGALGLVDYGGDTDALAPKLNTVFGDDHVPPLVQNFAVNNWDWNTNMPAGPIQDWEVTMTAFASTPGEVLELPQSGYDIGQGKQARVLFADDDSLTLKYTGEDNVVYGYTIHLVDICVEPSLRALYDANNAAGRSELPALSANQPLGRARSTSFKVTIRDTGAFMDPRSKKDWWP